MQQMLTIPQLLVIMSTTASIGGILVWGSQCLAYIRYYHWFHSFKERDILPEDYNRWEPRNGYRWVKSRMFMASWQPLPAYLGLICCFLIVFVLSTATWWNGNITFKKVATAYAGVRHT
jgi:amino acid transporter